MDLAQRRVIATIADPSTFEATVVSDDELGYVLKGQVLRSFDLAVGRERWRRTTPEECRQLLPTPTWVVCVGARRYFSLLRRAREKV